MLLSSHRTFVVRLFAIAGAGFVVVLVGLLAVRLLVSLERGERTSAIDFEVLNQELGSAFLAERTVRSAHFLAATATLANKAETGLAGLIIHGPEGVRYAFAVERDLIESDAATGAPLALRKRGLHGTFSAPFSGDPTATLTASYQLVGREQGFYMLRDALFLVLAFLLACAIALLLILILAPLLRRTAAAPWPDTAAASAVGADFAPRREAAAAESPAHGDPDPEPAAFGLEPQEMFLDRLDGELGRAAAYDHDLSLVLGVLTAVRATTDDSSERLAALLREVAPAPDLAFQYGAAGFALILPETDLDRALALMDDWRGHANDNSGLTVAVGIADRCGRLLGGERLVLETERALGRAMARGGDHLVGFRVDPVRFRELQQTADA